MITHLATDGGRCAEALPGGVPAESPGSGGGGAAGCAVAYDLQISAQVIYTWRRQQLIDSGQIPGMTSTDHAELVAARKRIAELESELAIHRRAAELLGDVVPPKGGMRRSS
jgi:transposase